MAERTLDITIISAKSLNKLNLIGKMDVYAVVYISGTISNNKDQVQKTHVDKDGDSNPNWNFPMKFIINESYALQNRLTLVIKIKTEGFLGDKDIGEVHVPIKELLEGTNNNGLHFVSYQVRKPSGKPKGELSFSYKFGEKVVVPALASEPVPAAAYPTGYPAAPPVDPAAAYPTGYTAAPSVDPAAAHPAGYPAAPSVDPVAAYPAGYPAGKVSKPDELVTAYPASNPNPNPKVDKVDDHVTAYPALASGSGSVYPPPYPPPIGAAPAGYPAATGGGVTGGAGVAYYPPPAPGGYPQGAYGYTPQQPNYGGYPPPQQGYGGYAQPMQQGYGYPPVVQQPQQKKKNKFGGMGLGAGLLGGALGGLLIGDIVSDAADGGGCGGGCGGGGCGGGF